MQGLSSQIVDYGYSRFYKQVEASKMQKFILVGVFASAGLLGGCVGGMATDKADGATAQLGPTQGSRVSGTASFAQVGDKVRVIAEVNGLSPGAHGFHIHEKGDCSAPDGTSAGGHFNPTAKPHGNPDHAEHHAGDMPQLIANAAGIATITAYLDGITLGEGANNIVGRSIIVHAAPDDFKTQPTGNSGARQACGVIVKK
jgi:superoxide dismutase, Cu-Zn family